MRCIVSFLAILVLTIVLASQPAQSVGATIPVENWVAVVGSASVSNSTSSSPSFAPSGSATTIGGNQVIGIFERISLADGDHIRASGTVYLERTGSQLENDNQMNTQIRIGLFEGDETVPLATGNNGIIAEYRGPLRQIDDPTQAGPFGAAAMNDGFGDSGIPVGEFIKGTPVSASFDLLITRDGNNLDITSTITNGSNYTQHHSVEDYAPLLATGFDFSFNRVGFLLGANASATLAQLQNVTVTTNVPEPVLGISLLAILFACPRMRLTDRG